MEQKGSAPMASKTVLVTGASGGIGKATALGLATMVAHIAIAGRDRERTESAAHEIQTAGGGRADVFVADLSSQVEMRRLAAEVLQTLPRIDVLINPAWPGARRCAPIASFMGRVQRAPRPRPGTDGRSRLPPSLRRLPQRRA